MFQKHTLFPTAICIYAIMQLSHSAWAAEPVLSLEDAAFLRDQTVRSIAAAKLSPGQTVGSFHNETSRILRVPGGNMGYPAFWVRDAAMMLGGNFVSADEIEGWIRLICSSVHGPDDWQVRPGVVAPAFTIPDHINFDGKPTFYPGNYETGDKQGGPPWGKYPPLDDNFFFLQIVYEHWKLTNDIGFFQSPVKTSFGEMKLADLCAKVYEASITDATTGLCTIGDIETENAKDWGFCDAESKSGKLLFPSILRFVAARELEALFSAAGDQSAAARFHADQLLIRASMAGTFLHVTENPNEGWLHSATGVCNQADVWGSAYAAYCAAVDDETSNKIARALVRAYRERTAVRDGCVRQLLTTDPLNGGGWERSVSALGDYQNGGYWGTPVGWYIAAIEKVDHAAARDLAKEYMQYLRDNPLSDGNAEACEWINPDLKKKSNPRYVATVSLPYLALQNAGLMPPTNGKTQR